MRMFYYLLLPKTRNKRVKHLPLPVIIQFQFFKAVFTDSLSRTPLRLPMTNLSVIFKRWCWDSRRSFIQRHNERCASVQRSVQVQSRL